MRCVDNWERCKSNVVFHCRTPRSLSKSCKLTWICLNHKMLVKHILLNVRLGLNPFSSLSFMQYMGLHVSSKTIFSQWLWEYLYFIFLSSSNRTHEPLAINRYLPVPHLYHCDSTSKTNHALCTIVTTPVPTDLTKCAVEPSDAAAFKGSNLYGINASAVVLTWHRHTLLNVCNNMDYNNTYDMGLLQDT